MSDIKHFAVRANGVVVSRPIGMPNMQAREATKTSAREHLDFDDLRFDNVYRYVKPTAQRLLQSQSTRFVSKNDEF